MTEGLIFVIGPTASGKSALAMELAKRFPVEIISMDSAQIYRGMDIGTAKPSAAEQLVCPHHLLDICDPVERYSAAAFAQDAARLAHEIQARGKLPLVVGGTFLYMRALLQGLHDMPAADADIRAQIDRDALEQGWPALHARLQQLDSIAAGKIHPNDAQRIQRALELAMMGQARSAHWAEQRQPVWCGPVLKLAVLPSDRERLRAKIALRFEQMMAQGFLDEVRCLFQRQDLHIGLPSIRSVGYRQLWQHLQGEWSLAEAVERGVIATRQYAKRQMTWLRSESELICVPEEAVDRLDFSVEQIMRFLDSTPA